MSVQKSAIGCSVAERIIRNKVINLAKLPFYLLSRKN